MTDIYMLCARGYPRHGSQTKEEGYIVKGVYSTMELAKYYQTTEGLWIEKSSLFYNRKEVDEFQLCIDKHKALAKLTTHERRILGLGVEN